MNFTGHFNGAVFAGVAANVVAVTTGYIQWNDLQMNNGWEKILTSKVVLESLGLFGIAWFMALFPDLDTGSIPQRWFYRLVFILLLIFYFTKRFDLFVALAFFIPLPLIHKHRGWTHWKITPWIISVFIVSMYEYFRAKNSWFSSFSWDNVLIFLKEYWVYVFACVLGHYIHLLLDAKKVKWLPFIHNSANHH